MQKTRLIASLIAVAAFGGALSAQPAANPLTAGAKTSFDIVKGYLTKAAAQMPAEKYAYKPTPEVRSFGQLIGHVADANFGICATVAGEKPPMGGFEGDSIEKTKTTKEELTKALDASLDYCDKVYAGMTDAAGGAKVKFFTGDMPKLSILEFNTHHDFEHYGNIVTYLRMNKLVPPSSQQ